MMNGRAIWQQIDLTWARKRFSELRTLIDRSVPDCLISGHETLIQGLTLPDAKDRHVLAAAIVGRVNVIVTYNLKDFPADKLAPYGLMAEHPDTFISHLLDLGSGGRYLTDAQSSGLAQESAKDGRGLSGDTGNPGIGRDGSVS